MAFIHSVHLFAHPHHSIVGDANRVVVEAFKWPDGNAERGASMDRCCFLYKTSPISFPTIAGFRRLSRLSKRWVRDASVVSPRCFLHDTVFLVGMRWEFGVTNSSTASGHLCRHSGICGDRGWGKNIFWWCDHPSDFVHACEFLEEFVCFMTNVQRCSCLATLNQSTLRERWCPTAAV